MVRSAVSLDDIKIGTRIRLARLQRDMSQQELAGSLKLSFQQVQKYEKGTNHVSAVRLHQIARILGVSFGYFFEDMEGEPSKSVQRGQPISSPAELVRTSEALALVIAFNRIQSPVLRKRCLALVRSLSDED